MKLCYKFILNFNVAHKLPTNTLENTETVDFVQNSVILQTADHE